MFVTMMTGLKMAIGNALWVFVNTKEVCARLGVEPESHKRAAMSVSQQAPIEPRPVIDGRLTSETLPRSGYRDVGVPGHWWGYRDWDAPKRRFPIRSDWKPWTDS